MQLHSSEVGDGYEWGRLNLQSVTEESRLDEFLSTAQLAGTEFTAGQWACVCVPACVCLCVSELHIWVIKVKDVVSIHMYWCHWFMTL